VGEPNDSGASQLEVCLSNPRLNTRACTLRAAGGSPRPSRPLFSCRLCDQ
jgi:hypothetical protein